MLHLLLLLLTYLQLLKRESSCYKVDATLGCKTDSGDIVIDT